MTFAPSRRAGLLLLIIALAVVRPVAAQEPDPGYSAQVAAGTCDAPGEVASPLNDLPAMAADRQGAAAASVATSAYSVVPLSLDVLQANPYAVVVRSAASDETVACGEVGGAVDASGALVIGLRPVAGSGYSGIAYLAPLAGDPAQTGISTFLANTGTATPAGDPSTYVPTVRRQVALIVASLQRVDALVASPNAADESWNQSLEAELALWQMIYADARAMTPPPDLETFHAAYVDALALLDGAAADIFTALETGDEATLAAADQKIDQAVAALRALDAPDATPAASPPAS